MKAIIFAIYLALAGLFLGSTFWPSQQRQQEARKDNLFTQEQIDSGYRLSVQRKLIAWAGIFISLSFLTTLALTGRGRRLADGFDKFWGGNWRLTVLSMAAFCYFGLELLNFPLAILGHEHWRAWGMTTQPLTDWLMDFAKARCLDCMIGTAIVLGFYRLIREFPRWWWRIAALLGGLLAVGFMWVLPVVIDPWFHTFTKLSEYKKVDEKTRKSLELSIRKLSDRAGIPVQEILVMDASRQGTHTNAYFTGFGSTRRIVLYDTLLEKNSIPAIVSVIGHEIGHWQHHHIVLGLFLGAIGAYLGLFLLSRILEWARGRAPLVLHGPADPAGWPLILWLSLVAGFVTQPFENAISRSFESQADWSALELTADPVSFIEAERNLAIHNKSHLAPNDLAVLWFYTHPPALDRIQMARDWTKERPKSVKN